MMFSFQVGISEMKWFFDQVVPQSFHRACFDRHSLPRARPSAAEHGFIGDGNFMEQRPDEPSLRVNSTI